MESEFLRAGGATRSCRRRRLFPLPDRQCQARARMVHLRGASPRRGVVAAALGGSLGKRRRGGAGGQTPARAVGVTDQHSQVQLYQDGPADKIFTFVKWMGGRERGRVPASGFAPGMEILGNRPLRDLFDAEFEGTIGALWKVGRPIVRIEVGKRDEAHLGALLHFWEWVTAITGECAGIDPFDQPGVEEGKIITRALMGDKGLAKRQAEFLRAKRERIAAEIRLGGGASRGKARPASATPPRPGKG